MSDVVYDLQPASYCKLQPTSHELLMEPTIFLGGRGRNRHSDFYIRCCRQCFAQLVDVFSDLSSLETIICFDAFLGRKWQGPCTSLALLFQKPKASLAASRHNWIELQFPCDQQRKSAQFFPRGTFCATFVPGPVLRVWRARAATLVRSSEPSSMQLTGPGPPRHSKSNCSMTGLERKPEATNCGRSPDVQVAYSCL